MEPGVSRLQAAHKAINSIGLGFDITQDINFDNCKWDSRLILVNEEQCRDLEIPGGVSIPNVPNSIKCVRGESIRIQSDVLTLVQMSEHFNQEMCLGGKIASGHFCASFGLPIRCLQDLASMYFAYDGWFVKCYAIELERYQLELLDHVKEAVPSLWDPEAIARFIKRFGTHVIVGVSMGGKDVLYVRQEEHSSHFDPSSIKKVMNDTASMEFKDSVDNHCLASEDLSNKKENHFVTHSRRGGSSQKMNHSEWLDTIDSEPDVISMFLLPLGHLFKNINGSGFMVHALSLYSRYKPPIEAVQHFFEFQLPREWAPVLSETSLGSRRKHQTNICLRFSILGPKLYINTIPVDVGNRPVTGMRILLEGTRSNRLAICLQHLTSRPMSLPLSDNANAYLSCDSHSCTSHKKLKWNCFAYVCTAPVESDDSVSIVTGAQLQVENKCLLLRLRFSKVIGGTLQRPPEWVDQSSPLGQLSSGLFVSFISEKQKKDTPKAGEITINSALYPTGPPARVQTPSLLRFVDTTEIIRGPQHNPGYWVVSGARFSVQNGKIYLSVKYSLLNFVVQCETAVL